MKIEAHTMQLRVSDLPAALACYQTLFGRALDLLPEDGVAESPLYPNCWLAVVQARPDPGRNRTASGRPWAEPTR